MIMKCIQEKNLIQGYFSILIFATKILLALPIFITLGTFALSDPTKNIFQPFFTLISSTFVIGTLVFTLQKDKEKNLEQLGARFILSGTMLLIGFGSISQLSLPGWERHILGWFGIMILTCGYGLFSYCLSDLTIESAKRSFSFKK